MLKKLLVFSCVFSGIAFADTSSLVVSSTNKLTDTSSFSISIPGGWSVYRTDFSRNEYNTFHKALSGLVGVSYSPFAISTSITNGINYRFICNAQPTSPDAVPYAAVIEIYQPINGEPVITSINEII